MAQPGQRAAHRGIRQRRPVGSTIGAGPTRSGGAASSCSGERAANGGCHRHCARRLLLGSTHGEWWCVNALCEAVGGTYSGRDDTELSTGFRIHWRKDDLHSATCPRQHSDDGSASDRTTDFFGTARKTTSEPCMSHPNWKSELLSLILNLVQILHLPFTKLQAHATQNARVPSYGDRS